MRLLLAVFMSTGMATTGVADIGNDITEPDATALKLPHCLYVQHDNIANNIFNSSGGQLNVYSSVGIDLGSRFCASNW